MFLEILGQRRCEWALRLLYDGGRIVGQSERKDVQWTTESVT